MTDLSKLTKAQLIEAIASMQDAADESSAASVSDPGSFEPVALKGGTVVGAESPYGRAAFVTVAEPRGKKVKLHRINAATAASLLTKQGQSALKSAASHADALAAYNAEQQD